jgi:hypothetical protein
MALMMVTGVLITIEHRSAVPQRFDAFDHGFGRHIAADA